jgi:uncharacterized protein YjeT (DUF2065 family)
MEDKQNTQKETQSSLPSSSKSERFFNWLAIGFFTLLSRLLILSGVLLFLTTCLARLIFHLPNPSWQNLNIIAGFAVICGVVIERVLKKRSE